MFCEKCGAENPDDGTFCQSCGASLTSAAKAKSKGGKTSRKTSSQSAENPSSPDVMGFPVKMILLFGAVAALAIGVLAGILAAAGAGDFTEGAMKGAFFFDRVLDGMLVAGVFIGFMALIASRKS